MPGRYSAQDYTRALQNLLPTGIAWPRHINSVLSSVLRGIAYGFYKVDERAQTLIGGAFPATALDLLSEWEETLGLPDLCSISEADTIAARQNAIVGKLTIARGLSKSGFIQFAADFGYEITITEFRQARAGWSVAGDRLNGEDWPFTWMVTVPDVTYKVARAGSARAGDPLRSWGNKTLICLLDRYSPPHTLYLLEFVEI